MTDDPDTDERAAGRNAPAAARRAADSDRVFVVDPDEIEAGTDPLGIGDGTAPVGSYVLVYSLGSAATMTVGALGAATFPPGTYAYVGSAFGSNGLGRVDRHRRVASGDHDVTHWHIDYFGSNPDATLDSVVAVPREDVECRLATEIADRRSPAVSAPLEGFGASDCACATHFLGGVDSARDADSPANSESDTLGVTAVDVAVSVIRS
ncbi:GIY-YIG nuclease family protein [Halobellus litoreus]|uniref:DUF123 domain-containing protein n=1 Tax=Halobellus litoreus TaxID=755310 RepID=A0ABD6DYJ9_9EURY